MSKLYPQPPKWAERFLSWYCKPALLEDLQGDLNEYFDRNVKAKGPLLAKLIYILDVIKFLRPYTIRKPQLINLLIHWIMIGSYIKTSTRSIQRNSLFSVINIVGLAISMSVGLLMIVFINDLLSYDDFHTKGDRIYRVTTTSQTHDHRRMRLASSSIRAGRQIKETIPGVEDVTILRRSFYGDAHIGDSKIPVEALWADQSFFNVFSFDLIQGSKTTALKDPYSLVVTEKMATKLFGKTDVLGSSVKFDTTEYLITGVMKDMPKNSHLRSDAFVSFSTIELAKPDFDGPFDGWDTFYSNYSYVLLAEDANISTVNAGIDKICKTENKSKDTPITLELLALNDIAIGEELSNQIGPTMNKIVIWVLIGLAFVVIVSACFNYTNLSIARALRRSREVGIRKVIGALKGHVMGQFIAESVMIALLALVISFLVFLFLRAQFVSLADFISNLVTLELTLAVLGYFIVFAIVVGILAGFLPALFFSRINAGQVLKDASSIRVFKRVTLRKALIITQYTFSLMFITSTIIGYQQYKSFLSFDLGFQTENIINIEMQGNSDEVLIKELSSMPEVTDISRSRIVTSVGSMYGTQAKYHGDSAVVWINFVDEEYFPLHGHKIIAGGNLHPKAADSIETEVIVNEEMLKRFDIAKRNPEKAVGEVLNVDGKDLAIVGVLKDFHYGTVHSRIEPVAFRYSKSERHGYLNLKVASTDLPATMASIEHAWKKVDDVHPVKAQFYDDRIQENYSQFMVMVKVIGFLALLAVCIASMGLFGMVVFSTERRLKEISIRKVLGASEGKLVYLLSKGFFILLLVSIFVATPATYLFFDNVVLSSIAYHQPIGWTEMVIGPVGVMVLAFLMIGSQTLRVARTNPAEVLKNE